MIAIGAALIAEGAACTWEESSDATPTVDGGVDAPGDSSMREAAATGDAAPEATTPADPTLIAVGIAPVDIVADATHVYWVEAGRTKEEDAGPAKLAVVRRASKASGVIEVVAQNDRPFAGLVVDAEFFYTATATATSYFPDQIVRRSKDGKSPSQVVAVLKTPLTDLVLRDDATSIYAGSSSRIPSTLLRAEKNPTDAGAPASSWLVGTSQGPRYLDFAVAPDGVFATWNDWTVRLIDKSDSSSRAVVAAEQVDPSGVVVDGDHVFWAVSGTGVIMRAPRPSIGASDAGAQIVVDFTAGSRPTKIRASSTHIVWQDGSKLKKVKKTGGFVSQVVEAEEITDFAVDDGKVYWTERQTGRIRRHDL